MSVCACEILKVRGTGTCLGHTGCTNLNKKETVAIKERLSA